MRKIILGFVITLLAAGIAGGTIADVRVYFSPNGGCADAVKQAIRGARKTVDVAIYTFTRADIARVIDSAAQRGVRVRLVMDRGQGESQYSEDRFLLSRKVPLRFGGGAGVMHDKFVVIDDSLVVTGSYNWSEAAEIRNDENLLVVASREIAGVYSGRFEFLWTYGFSDTSLLSKPGAAHDEDKVVLPEPATPAVQGATTPSEAGETVYITKSGKKYHRAGCSSLAKSAIPISRIEAEKRGYTPCSRCRP